MNKIKLILINLAVFAAVFLPLYLLAPVDLSSMAIHGWGWAVVILSCVAVSFAVDFMEGFIGNSISDNVDIPAEIVYVGKATLSCMTVGAGFALGAWLAPSLVTAAALPVILYWAMIGVASGTADVITERLGYGTKRRF
jgi:hypothetical protein